MVSNENGGSNMVMPVSPMGGGYLRAKYRVSPLNGSYYPYQYDAEKTNDQDGYAGAIGKAIDRLQITLSP